MASVPTRPQRHMELLIRRCSGSAPLGYQRSAMRQSKSGGKRAESNCRPFGFQSDGVGPGLSLLVSFCPFQLGDRGTSSVPVPPHPGWSLGVCDQCVTRPVATQAPSGCTQSRHTANATRLTTEGGVMHWRKRVSAIVLVALDAAACSESSSATSTSARPERFELPTF